MNEQIRELEKQCWSHYVNGVLIDGHLHFDAQKLAELIVKECIRMCDVAAAAHLADDTEKLCSAHQSVIDSTTKVLSVSMFG
jgi:hypothetical protein